MTQQIAGKVPQIRFKGFEEQWAEKKLGDLGTFKNGMNFGKEAMGHGNPFVNLQNVFGHLEVDDKKLELAESSPMQRREYNLLKGDVLFIRSSVKPEGVGETALITKTLMDTTYSGFIIRYRLEVRMSHSFNRIAYRTILVRKQILANASRSANTNINQKALQKIALGIPRFDEQTQIGDYFRDLDRLIGLHQRKHDKLVTLKKAMLQKMFPQPGATTPEIRFKGFEGDWVEKKLGECALIQRGGSPRPIEDFITQEANGINWVKIGDVKLGSRYITKTEGKIKPEGVSKSREVFKGDLILSNSMSFGRPYLMAIDGCIHDGWLLIRNDKNLFDLDYLLQLLSSETMTEQYRSLAAGGVVNNLNSALVQSTNISFPDKPEQQKIGIYFRQLDALISQHATQLQKLKQLESACLEKMFV